MEPILIDVPERLDTERLILRAPRAGDGALVNEAICASQAELAPWMPWAGTAPTLAESEAHCRRQQGRFILREDFVWLLLRRGDDGSEAELVGGTGLHRIDWTLRKFEIGYWRKTGAHGHGFVTEAVRAVSRLAFDVLDARRVEIRMDDRNARSWRVAERAGFTLEALLRFDSATPAGEPRSTRIYARVRGGEEPIGPARRRRAERAAQSRVAAGREPVDRIGDDAVDAERIEPARLGRIVDGVDEAAQAGAVQRGEHGRIHHRIVRDHRGAAERLASASQSGRSASRSRPRGRCGAVSRAPASALGSNEVSSSGAASGADHDRGRRADDAPGLVFPPGRRLDLEVEREGVAQAEAGDRREARRRLAGVGAAMPAAGVEARQLGPGQRRGRAVTRGRALQGGVVEQERHAIGRQLDVALEGAKAVRGAEPKRGQRVLGRQLAGAAMRDPARERPGGGTAHRDASGAARRGGHAGCGTGTRAALAASNQCRRAGAARTWTTSSTFGYGSVASRRTVNSPSPSRP